MNRERSFETSELNGGDAGEQCSATAEEQLDTITSQTSREKTTGVFHRIVFQKLLLFSTVRLIIYLNKLYQDVNAVGEYSSKDYYKYCIISVLALTSPIIIYTFYLIGAHLAKDDIIDKVDVSTRTVNGLLLIPWQIKRHLDMLYFTAQRACQWRKPAKEEREEIKSLERNAEILEFFEDFYSGFLQLLLQIYILLGSDVLISGQKSSLRPLIGQLVGSALAIFSMMIASRRRDDGPLTGFLSFVGWFCVFTSRVIVFSLVATYIRHWLFVLCLIHVLAFSIWIYTIAIESYKISSSSTTAIAPWESKRKRASIAILVFLFFGLPSLVFWPIMFQLKECKRPLIFLMVITIENVLLLGIWAVCHVTVVGAQLSDLQIITVSLIVISTLGGAFFLLVYVFCKPKYTDQVVLYEIRESKNRPAPDFIKLNARTNNASNYGIYYEFCDIVFKLPSTHKISERLEQIRRMQDQIN
ncbi:hypothetical protein B4U79_12785 [Dinothrombium tinctorium]|uniref:XK-related protein n=1 Tax=Dinothrombium tinctorium TaxID=1965070 RepID=A0A443R4G8_9ACAR|nr:hypothetical protein B4U79_12785 [Dinothrombium tinctorium]